MALGSLVEVDTEEPGIAVVESEGLDNLLVVDSEVIGNLGVVDSGALDSLVLLDIEILGSLVVEVELTVAFIRS